MLWRSSLRDYRLALTALLIVAGMVVVRLGLFAVGIEGVPLTPLTSSVIGAGVFVIGLVIVGVMGDYREAERTPGDIAAGLLSILREAEAFHREWAVPNVAQLRLRLGAVVVALRRDIDSGRSRDALFMVEMLSDSISELDGSPVPASYISRLRGEQAKLRESVLKVYSIQREQFLPSAYAMIVSFVALILLRLLFADIEGDSTGDNVVASLSTMAFLSFFFIYLLLLLNVINRPFRVGRDRGNDAISLMPLYEFIVHAKLAGTPVADTAAVIDVAEQLEVVVSQSIDPQEAHREVDRMMAERFGVPGPPQP